MGSPMGACVQVHPSSTLQSDEQPSPLAWLASSQPSLSTRPSPHSDTQAPFAQFGSFWHSAEQPSKGRLLPSSQPSPPSVCLSPQTVFLHTLGLPLHL